ncbi:MAG: Crp/Fnr family transcriptional regulator [Elusimicrobia bacterium]|nr:Crp/Fnr family transcriptional regulator [Elusimicrobiota bacterium]
MTARLKDSCGKMLAVKNMPPRPSDIFRFLSSFEPFKALPKKDLEHLALSTAHGTYKKKETVFSEGGAADRVWVVYRGRMHIFKYTSGGKSLAIENLVAGDIFGTLCRLSGNGRVYRCTAVAAQPAEALSIPDRLFNRHLSVPKMALSVCALCAQRLKEIHDLRCIQTEPVDTRMAHILLQLSKKTGSDDLALTKKEIGDLCGVSTETVFRTLSKFQKKGWLESGWGKIQIKKKEALERLAQKP